MGWVSLKIPLLPPNTKIYNKMSFDLIAQADVLEAVKE